MIKRKHAVISFDHVNPIYIDNVEQIHRVCGTPVARVRQKAIPANPDLL